jgi:iron complex outermembrane receptor protein
LLVYKQHKFKEHFLKTKLSIAIATALSLPSIVLADTEQLTTLIVEGSESRPGAMAMVPDSSGLKDTTALLEKVPGANINRNGPLTGIAQYRGMSGDRINITVDGANMKGVGPNAMDPALSHVPAALTESLTVYRGIAPVSSGIDTIGGSMKMESKKGSFAEEGQTYEYDGALSSGYSSVDNGYYVAGFNSIANKNHKIHVGVTKEEGDDYDFADGTVSSTEYDRQALIVGYEYQNKGHELGFNFTDNNTIDSGTPALPMDIIYVDGGLYNFDYNWDMGNGYKLETAYFYQDMSHYMDNHTLRTPAQQNDADKLMDNTTTVQGGGWDMTLVMPMDSGDLKVGFTGDKSNHEADQHMNMVMMAGQDPVDINTTIFNGVERSRYSFFGERDIDITHKLSTELGMRYTYTKAVAGDVSTTSTDTTEANATSFNDSDRDLDFHGIDWAAIARYAARDDLDLEVGFARKTRAPSYQELFLWDPAEATGGLADGKTYIGNLDLNIETAYQLEFGLDWHTDKAYFSPRAFYHYVNDYIQGSKAYDDNGDNLLDDNGNQVLKFNNINAHIFGFDVDMGYVFTQNWRIDAGSNFAVGKEDEGGFLYRMAPFNARAQITFEHSGFMASVEGIGYAEQTRVADYNDEKPTDGYGVMNLRANYEAFDGFIIGAGIENVIDSVNENHLGGYSRVRSIDSDVDQGSRIPMPGRNYYTTLTYQW